MLALLGYPLLIEPSLRLREQSWAWSGGYAVLALLLTACAVLSWKPAPAMLPAAGRRPRPTEDRPRAALSAVVDWRRRARWLALSFVPSSWMLGVTAFVTTDIAPMPFLWVIPLSLYLLSFILVFARRPLMPHEWMVRIFPFTMLLLAISLIFSMTWQTMMLHLAVFFVGSMVCHGDLVRDRPAVSHLTEYYFWISAGGVLGGVFNALIAPLLFTTLLEYPVTLILACLMRPTFYPTGAENSNRRLDLAVLALLAASIVGFRKVAEFMGSDFLIGLVLLAMPLLIGFYLFDRTRAFALGMAVLLVAQKIEPPFNADVLFYGRWFFGIDRVLD
jgi:hypothetical protein